MKDKDPQPHRSVTADDVANLAGVSRWTVARAFKPDASISQRSRERILNVANQLGYVPDLLASSLASDRTNLVALLIDDFQNPHKLISLNHLTDALQEAGTAAILINTARHKSMAEALLNASQRRVDAAVLIGTRFSDQLLDSALGARKIKKLIVFARESDNPNTPSISCNEDIAVAAITRHILGKGYGRPMYLAGPDTQSASLRRGPAFVRELGQAAGITPEVVHAGAYNSELARQVVREALGARARNAYPDILLCENDILAMGAMDAVRHEMKLRVPEDIGIIGFDNIGLAASPAYDLTTYEQPIREMAVCLIRILKSDEEPVGSIYIEGRFIERSSA